MSLVIPLHPRCCKSPMGRWRCHGSMRALRCNELPESAATCYNISMQTTSSTLKIENLVVILLGILVLIALAGVLHLLRGIILPFLVALFLAYLLEPLVRLLTRLHVPHAVATTTALLSTFILLVLMGILLYTGAQSFAKGYPPGTHHARVANLPRHQSVYQPGNGHSGERF